VSEDFSARSRGDFNVRGGIVEGHGFGFGFGARIKVFGDFGKKFFRGNVTEDEGGSNNGGRSDQQVGNVNLHGRSMALG
jgi:hypothetical protein